MFRGKRIRSLITFVLFLTHHKYVSTQSPHRKEVRVDRWVKQNTGLSARRPLFVSCVKVKVDTYVTYLTYVTHLTVMYVT